MLYLSYRHYWDDWRIRSNAYDVKYRRELSGDFFLEPHVRYYTQTPASFFTFGLPRNAPLPAYATSDFRLGRLRTLTLGATFGFRVPQTPGEFTLRAEFIRQTGAGPDRPIGVQQNLDLFPGVSIGSLVVAYSVGI